MDKPSKKKRYPKIRVAGPQEHGLTFVGTLSIAGPVSSPFHSTDRASSPASGCHHRAVPDDRNRFAGTGLAP